MKLKKILAVVSALCMTCAVMPVSEKYIPGTAISASAEEYTEGTYENLIYYRKYTDYVEISGVTDKEITEVNIPAEIDGLPVTTIGIWAFGECSKLNSITIPSTVTSIGENAFILTPWLRAKLAESPFLIINDILFDGTNCEGDVTIPEGVTTIGYRAFSPSGLTSVTIPESVISIEEGAFYWCTGLTSITIPDSVTNIGGTAFFETPWLKAKQAENPLVIVNGILIDGAACKGDVTIPESVTSIADDAFSHSELTSVTIPESVTSIGDGTFFDCSGLTSVTIPESVTSIGDSAFYFCSGLTSVTIPESVTSIEAKAFMFCSALTSVTIENPDCEIYDSYYTISNENVDFNGTIYGYENSTAQAYAEKYNRKFESLGSAPETTEPTETETSAPVVPAEDMVWNGVNPDINRDGTIDAADSAVLLTYAAEFGAGKVTSFKEFMDKYYS